MIRLGGPHAPATDIDLTFLDCDGVVFDTNALKPRAFVAALADFPSEDVRAVVEHHQRTGGVSRHEKLRRFFTQVHPVADPEAAIARALVRFGEVSRQIYREVEPFQEALEFARRMGGPKSVYIASGADQAELREIFEDHGIRDHFREIYGSPIPKRQRMREVLTATGLSGDRALMVGDGPADLEAAHELGVHFVFLERHSDWADARQALSSLEFGHIAADWATLLSWT